MSDKKCVGKCISTNEKTIHPFNLRIIENLKNNNICPTKNYYDKKNKKTTDITEKCNNISHSDIVNFMDKPYVYIDNIFLLENVFKINDVDDIKEWVDNNISKPTRYLGRVVNIWIKINLKELKKYQQLLTKIVGDIVIKKELIDKKNNEKFLIKILPKFIKAWIEKINIDNFYFDIFHDLEKFINK